ncbi:Williams-Beuren syndrome chromosomal region 27 protein [Elysia marginata]|uniref:Williams-Beuren syndrome chromosomal region 27 protein n=1 Tax=Elysia marginata TaxID=1093978 RepID=A0AAV4EBX5_9GAST|nr:Williams-Beuren syndrome chromosomal region 27 protein [Elysia marginata]
MTEKNNKKKRTTEFLYQTFLDPSVGTENTSKIYGKYSKEYDEIMSKFQFKAPHYMVESLCRVVGDKDRTQIKILDMACGSGIAGEALYAAGFTQIDGLDGSEEMLAVSRSKAVYTNLFEAFVAIGKGQVDIPDNRIYKSFKRGDKLANHQKGRHHDRRPRGYRKTQTTLLSSSSKTEKRLVKMRQNHKKNTKLKLYKALVKSVLTYNCGTWALTQSQEERLNAFHRKQLKKVLNIKYPVKITNSSLYNKCNERPLSIFILDSRWRLFGHILRRDSQIPANQAMSGSFVTEGSKFIGRPLTTLPVVLNRDLSRIINSNLQLKSRHDLEHLRSIAQQRDEWTKLTARIREAAEASQSEH